MADLVSDEQLLENLCYKCNLSFENGCTDRCNSRCETYRKLKRGLDVLEILKKYISIFENPNTVKKFRYVYTSGYITKEEYDLLKEWLENDNRFNGDK